MYDLILQFALMISLAVIVYLMAVAVPRVEDTKETGGNGNGLPLERLDATLLKWKDKTLRRVKVLILKADNYVSRQLKKDKESL